MDLPDRAGHRSATGNLKPSAGPLLDRVAPPPVVGCKARRSWFDQDLNEAERSVRRAVHLRVEDPQAGALVPCVAAPKGRVVAGGIAMAQFALDAVRDDLNVLVRMEVKTAARLDKEVVEGVKHAETTD